MLVKETLKILMIKNSKFIQSMIFLNIVRMLIIFFEKFFIILNKTLDSHASLIKVAKRKLFFQSKPLVLNVAK